MAKGIVKFIGVDISTTTVSGIGCTDKDEIVFASVPMRGATTWHNQPAHDLYALIKGLFLDEGILYKVISLLEQQSDGLASDGAICFSVRQHDMVLTDDEMHLLMPALSWQCNFAIKEVEELKKMGLENIVGPIEPRFILPKLLKTLREDTDSPNMIYFLSHVMTTGDWIGVNLTGRMALSSSDALSNGLLQQKNKRLAIKALRNAGLNPMWFPPVIQSGTALGHVRVKEGSNWEKLCKKLHSWLVIAGLGDNHASAVGCGLDGFDKIIVSVGTSGTVVRLCHNNAQTNALMRSGAVNFEFFDRRMLLMMLGDCASMFVRFAEQYGKGYTYDQLDELAPKIWTPEFMKALELDYDAAMKTLSDLGEKVTYVRYKIAKELGELTYKMKEAIEQREKIRKVILTGGMTKSGLFLKFLKEYLVFMNAPIYMLEDDSIASKAAPYGALITAMVGAGYFPDLKTAIKEMCVLKQI